MSSKGSKRRPGAGYEEHYEQIFKEENTMKDPHDTDTRDIDEFLEEEEAVGSPPAINFNEHDSPEEYNADVVTCPCCHENEVSGEQIDDQVLGETCTVCNFHTWDDLS